MIIDITSNPLSEERIFFGLKKNGRFFFNDSNNRETPYFSLKVSQSDGRIEGESLFIKLTSINSKFHGKELLCSISKNDESEKVYYVEIYDLENKNMS